MSDPLPTYLHDHLAGSHFAIKLLESLRDQYHGEPLEPFAEALIHEITADQKTLETIIDSVGKTRLDLTETIGWFAEKASQLKLRRDDDAVGIGTFEALETLTLGIRGKLALWQVLPVIRKTDSRIPEMDFEALATSAQAQYARVEERRLELASLAFKL